MYQQENFEAVNMMQSNLNPWSEVIAGKALSRFERKKVQQPEKKMRLDVRSLSDFTLPTWVC